jgi:hypothetical protein
MKVVVLVLFLVAALARSAGADLVYDFTWTQSNPASQTIVATAPPGEVFIAEIVSVVLGPIQVNPCGATIRDGTLYRLSVSDNFGNSASAYCQGTEHINAQTGAVTFTNLVQQQQQVTLANPVGELELDVVTAAFTATGNGSLRLVTGTDPVAAVPEPFTLLLFGTGAALVAGGRYLKK